MKKFVAIMFSVGVITAIGVLANCGFGINDNQARLNQINDQINALVSTTDSLGVLIESEYASCANVGDTSDALLRKICEVAQAASSEVQTELLAQLGVLQNLLQTQIDQLRTDLINESVALNARIDAADTDIANLQSDLSDLTDRMDDAEAAIIVIENYIHVAQNHPLTGNMKMISIGKENLAAGPVYEIVLMKSDYKQVNAYIEDYETPAVAVDNNGLESFIGTPTVTVTIGGGHTYVAGDLVRISGVAFTIGSVNINLLPSDFNGRLFVVKAPVTGTQFDITMPRNASANKAAFGGAGITVSKLNGRRMDTIWSFGDAFDAAVRTTSVGTSPYNFMILDRGAGLAEVCYSTTVALETAVNIIAGGGDIVCKLP
jgi:hypothetical protein